MAQSGEHSNGYVRLSTLMAVGCPIVGGLCIAIAVFVNLTIAPLAKDIQQNKEAIDSIRIDLVPRKEHEKDWIGQRNTDEVQDERIEQMRNDFGSTYSLKDALADFRNRLEKVETARK